MSDASMNTIILTGAAGFIGSHVADRLLSHGNRVIGIDNLALGKMENLSEALKNPNFVFIETDLNGPDLKEKLVPHITEGASAVWHFAANSDIVKGVEDPQVDLRDTFMTTFNVLSLMKEFKIKQLVFASTSAIYGANKEILAEDTGPLFPISNYGAMKLASEGIITAALENFLEKVWIFRFPNVVGSRATHGAIYDFVRKLKINPTELEVLGDGTQIKPYLHVTELIDAMLFVVEKSQEKLNYFNIGQTGGRSTVKFIAEEVVKAVSPSASVRYSGGSRGWVGDVPQFTLSVEKIQALGWSPVLNSNESVIRAVKECV